MPREVERGWRWTDRCIERHGWEDWCRPRERERQREQQTFINLGGNGSVKVRGEEPAASLISQHYWDLPGSSNAAAPLEIQGDARMPSPRGCRARFLWLNKSSMDTHTFRTETQRKAVPSKVSSAREAPWKGSGVHTVTKKTEYELHEILTVQCEYFTTCQWDLLDVNHVCFSCKN